MADDANTELVDQFEDLMVAFESGNDVNQLKGAAQTIMAACDEEIQGLKNDLQGDEDDKVKAWLQEELEAYEGMKQVLLEIQSKIDS